MHDSFCNFFLFEYYYSQNNKTAYLYYYSLLDKNIFKNMIKRFNNLRIFNHE